MSMQNLSYETQIFTKDDILCAHLTFHLKKRPFEVALAFRSATRENIEGELINLLSRPFDEEDEMQMKWLLQGLHEFPNKMYEKKCCRSLVHNEKVSIIVRDALVYNPISENFRIELSLPNVDCIYVRVAYDERFFVLNKINLTQEERTSDHVSSIAKSEERLACKARYTAGNIVWNAQRDYEREQRNLDS